VETLSRMGRWAHENRIPKIEADWTLALAGNPNVGKSSVFNQLTGLGVTTANYPGKTVELNIGVAMHDGERVGIIDLPGTYALGAVSEDQWVARRGLLDARPDVVAVILDATNLERNLYLLLQLQDLCVPVVGAVNLMDIAARRGLEIDFDKLSAELHAPAVPMVAIRGEGVHEMVEAAGSMRRTGEPAPPAYFAPAVEREIQRVAETAERRLGTRPLGLPARALAIVLLEGDREYVEATEAEPGGAEVLTVADEAAARIRREFGEPASARIVRERHGFAGRLAAAAVSRRPVPAATQMLYRASLSPVAGTCILLATAAAVFLFMFYVGGFLGELLGTVWGRTAAPGLTWVLHRLFGEGFLASTLTWGLVDGVEGALGVGIPYIFTLYFILALLEDSGYLNAVAFLSDSLMHRVGLHGRAVLALVAGTGCNVPAIVGTRVLNTMRERIIASTLVVLAPCSARTAIILGTVALYSGLGAAVGLYAITAAVIFTVGLVLNRVLPGRSMGLVMEMFPFRRPSLRAVVRKTWFRFRDFLVFAAPIIIIGSMVLGALYNLGWIDAAVKPLAPIIHWWLGLPGVAGIVLVMAILRKEMALQLLVTVAIAAYGGGIRDISDFMTAGQMFVFALVATLYFPCISAFAVLSRELGRKHALGIAGLSIVLALIVGGAARWIIALI
jgi:ferrous iron transport protein B